MRVWVVSVALLAFLSCSDDPAGSPPDSGATSADISEVDPGLPAIDPISGSGFGHFVLRIDTASVDIGVTEVVAVTVGDIATYDLNVAADGWLEVTVQGGPPGEAAVVLETDSETIEMPAKLVYDPPVDPVFDRMAAIGASLTQGVQRATPSLHGGLMSPPSQLARQAGAFFPMPLLVPGLFPQMAPSDVSPPPDCATPDVVGFIVSALPEIVDKLKDENRVARAYLGRVDPDIRVQNLAVGNAGIATVLVPPPPTDIAAILLSYFVLEPYTELLQPIEYSQFDRLIEIEPTLIMSTDLYGNDIIGASIGLGANPTDDVMTAAVDEVVDALAGTGAQVFLSNLPMPSLLPTAATRMEDAISAGDEDTVASLQETDRMAGVANSALQAAADRHDNVHVVDTTDTIDRLVTEGIVTENGTLTVSKFGGLVGLDGLHFSDSGYAMLANLFAEAINETLGTNVPLIDIATVAETDVDTPWALEAEGIDVDACNE